MGFTKCDNGIVDSSIWDECSDVLKVFEAFWTKSNPDGIVNATYSAMVRNANLRDKEKNPLPLSAFDDALKILLSPDPSSRSKKHGGRRIIKLEDSKWLIVNYKKYRESTYSDNPEAVRKREYRAKNGTTRDMSQNVLGHSASVSASLSASGKEGMQGEESAFDRFWKEYPKKRSKGAAIRAWAKIKEPAATLQLVLKALTWQKKSHEWKRMVGNLSLTLRAT